VGQACRSHGKFLGMGGVYDQENAARYIAAGAQFILAGSDHMYLTTGASERAGFLNSLRRQA
jgi:2-keto-3-deoxy-L-rhamnonate aldolase RhmA